MSDVFLQLSVILGIALILSLIVKLLRQPLIVSYILTGIIVGPAVFKLIPHTESLEAFAHIGVALLLFIVGLGLKPTVIKEVGKIAIVGGLGQIIFTTVIGFFLAKIIGLSSIAAFYIALAFTLSSTIIIFRMLAKKDEQDTLYGRITIGFLLVQDLAAMFFFIIVSSYASIGSGDFINVVLFLILKMAVLLVGLYVFVKFIIHRVDKFFADNQEMLFVFALGLCFVISSIFYKFGFSLELGALAAGVMLSISPFQRDIASKISPLRDFFIIIFFILVGSNISLNGIVENWLLIIVFCLFILIGNPLIIILVMKKLGYTTRTSFYSGISMAQISEFSLILLGMGAGFGHLSASIVSAGTMVGIITIVISSYFITYNHQIYKKLKKYLERILPDKKEKIEKRIIKKKYDVIVFGCHRTGGGLVKLLKKMNYKFLVVDHDPEVIRFLTEKKIDSLYGSADDTEFIDSLPIADAKLVISTIPEFEINRYVVMHLRRHFKRKKIICISYHFEEANKLYELGADYVILPQYIGRKFFTDFLRKNKLDSKKYKDEREKHILDLKYLNNSTRIEV